MLHALSHRLRGVPMKPVVDNDRLDALDVALFKDVEVCVMGAPGILYSTCVHWVEIAAMPSTPPAPAHGMLHCCRIRVMRGWQAGEVAALVAAAVATYPAGNDSA